MDNLDLTRNIKNFKENIVTNESFEKEEMKIGTHDSIHQNEIQKKAEKLETMPTLKRSSRRQTGSIIQNAIDRKEKALDYDNNAQKRIKRRVKKYRNGMAIEDKTDSTKLTVNKKLKNFKVNCTESENSEAALTQNGELPVRRSERILTNEKEDLKITNDKSTNSGLSSTDKDVVSSRLCKCSENKNFYLDSSENAFWQSENFHQQFERNPVICYTDCSKLSERQTTGTGVYVQDREIQMSYSLGEQATVFQAEVYAIIMLATLEEGNFAQCTSKHQYHRNCQLSVEDRKCCPHCGICDTKDIFITMHCSKKPVFLPIQKTQESTAKMSFLKNQESPFHPESPLHSPLIESLENLIHHLTNDRKNNSKIYSLNDLFDAISGGDVKKVATILEKNNIDLKLTFPEINQGTLLHLAVKQGNLTIVHLLISKGVDVDVFDKDQNTPLMLAVMENKNDLVQFLIQSGSDIKMKGTDGMSALHISAKCGNLDACKLVLKASFGIPDFINNQDDGGWTPLVWACEHSHFEVVKFLIEKGASVTLRDVEYNSALHWAALSGNNDIVELLLNFGCEVNVVNVHGETPLHISAREDHANCVITLLARGANISLVNRNQEQPLDCAPKGSSSYTAISLNVQLQKNVKFGDSSLLHNDISRGREQNPIQCLNTLDPETEPRDYIYILKNRFASDNISIDTRISIMRSCSCEDKCISTGCSCNEVSVGHWYDQDGKLIPEFNFNDPPMLFECNEMCSCNYITCTNRVVQKGLTHRFQLFRTKNKGWGVKSLNAVPKGSFVAEYIGEILTDREADRREDDSYLFDLDNRDSDSFCVDAKFYGNFARFINHSCDPNLHSIKVFVDHHDLRFPRIALFAKRDIAATEELSFDYGDKFWLVKYKSFTCDCRSLSCKYSTESIQKTLDTYYKNHI